MKKKSKLNKRKKAKIVTYIKVASSSFLSVLLLDNFYSHYDDLSYLVGALIGSILTFMYIG